VVRENLGSLDKVKRIVKVLGMVNCADGFGDQPRVMNGFSDLMVEVFGEAIGKHARSAVGMAGLPNNIPVEIEMILEVE
jgi:enamine deaminase RidA (YjgF/YER057c/UK114 family)